MFKLTVCFVIILLSACNGAPSDSTDRIVGGAEAEKGAAPYQVALFTSSNSFLCGGSIVSRRAILTAAHCVDGMKPSDIQVLVGTNSLSTGGTKYSVNGFMIHSSWDPNKATNDIALLYLSEGIELSDSVKIVGLEYENVGENEDVVITGWGSLGVGLPIPDKLQILDLKTTTREECDIFPIPVTAFHICTFTRAGEGLCNGDSGGPLVRNGKQVGIVSFGFPCAIGYPDVYTRVSAYEGWIDRYIIY